MNIAIDVRPLLDKYPSGVGSYLANMLSSIFALDQINHYWLYTSGFARAPKLPPSFNQSNVKHIHYRMPNKLINFRLWLGWGPDLAAKIPVKLDLFWLPNMTFYKFRPDLPVILTIHDLSFLHSCHFFSLKRRFWHNLVNIKKLILGTKKIIAVSSHTKRDIVRFFPIAEEKITVIYPGINTKQIKESKAKQSVSRFFLPKKYFVYVGTLEPRKNIDSIIRAFDRLHQIYPEIYLVIVGGPGWEYQPILGAIKKRNYVIYLGYLSGAEKDAVYYFSQGLIWPSFYEGYGFPPLEATYHHKPVITSFKTSLPEIMKNQAIYVDPYNVSDIFQALKSLATDRELNNNFKTSAKNFSIPDWHDQAKRIISLFREIVSSP